MSTNKCFKHIFNRQSESRIHPTALSKNQHSLESMDQEHQLGADDTVVSVISQGNHKSKGVAVPL
jgi:hypothetical protein